VFRPHFTQTPPEIFSVTENCSSFCIILVIKWIFTVVCGGAEAFLQDMSRFCRAPRPNSLTTRKSTRRDGFHFPVKLCGGVLSESWTLVLRLLDFYQHQVWVRDRRYETLRKLEWRSAFEWRTTGDWCRVGTGISVVKFTGQQLANLHKFTHIFTFD